MLGNRFRFVLLVVALLMPAAAGQAMIGPMERLARQSLSDDEAVRQRAVEGLRRIGPPAMGMLLDMQKQAMAPSAESKGSTTSDAADLEKIRRAIDAVAAQKDAWVSGLFWYTDLEEAKVAASASGRPILSLRLLGRLDEELSCANSRFFRTALYANSGVAEYLRWHYVLHWQSVRPAPVITIDFGDGRRIERTLTGNSIHYILDSRGRLLDGLPGLYAPATFLANLQTWGPPEVIARMNGLSDAELHTRLAYHHRGQMNELARRWDAQMKTIDRFNKEGRELNAVEVQNEAVAAQLRSIGKAVMEMPMMEALMPQIAKLEERTDAAMWRDLAALYAEQAKLDDASVMLMRSKHPTAQEAGRRAETKRRVEDPILKVVQSFERSIAEDTVRNEYQLRPTLRQWIVTPPDAPVANLASLNERVYAELFLTPSDDPWLGLGSEETYTALPERGIVVR